MEKVRNVKKNFKKIRILKETEKILAIANYIQSLCKKFKTTVTIWSIEWEYPF